MKFDCDARYNRKTNWHKWFAWYPVKIGPSDCRWLEVVWRKGERLWCMGAMDSYWDYEYRSLDAATD